MRRASLLLVLALLAAACSDSGEEPDVITTTPATSLAPAPIGPGTTSSTSTTITSVEEPTTTTTMPLPPLQGLGIDTVARGLDKPVFVAAPPGDERMFVVEQDGVIRILEDGEIEEEPFLDIRADVGSEGLEQGLLGLAFHPDFGDNGKFYVYYTNRGGNTRVVEFSVADEGDEANEDSARVVIGNDQPAGNHNGGMIQFGPDGYLYVALGDGGGANDQFGNGQRPDTLLGTILRLDVDAAEPYAVPPDNPFVDGGGAREVWAFGLRNPWRFDIDSVERLIYIGDVGQDQWEEVNVAPLSEPGLNYGWPILEASQCFAESGCSAEGTVLPVAEFNHAEGCSVIGGFVYRGAAIPELSGHYFYSDYCGGFLRSFRFDGGEATEAADWTPDVAIAGEVLSFGVDGFGELYLTTSEGFLFKVVPVRR